MPVDASIPLQAGNVSTPLLSIGDDMGKMLSLADIAQKFRTQTQAVQNQNALKTIFSNPGSYDPKTGDFTPQAIQAIGGIDPQTGLKVKEDTLENQVKKAQIAHYQTEAGKQKFDFMSGAAGVGVDAYNQAKQEGRSEQDARAAAITARNQAVKENGGIISNEDAAAISAAPFDPLQAKVFAMTNKDYSSRVEKAATDTRLEKHQSTEEGLEKQRLGIEQQRVDVEKSGGGKWEILTDPTKKDDAGNPVQYRYNPNNAEATTLDGKSYEPGGASKLGSGAGGGKFTPEMGTLMGALAEKGVSLPAGLRSKEQQMELYDGILKRNPGKSPDEIAEMIKRGQIEFGVEKKETQTAAAIAGKVRTAEEDIKGMAPALLEASAAVPRGSFVPINKLMQMGQASISDPNLKTLKVYTQSMLNAYDVLAGRGGTDAAKREENHALLLNADSPEAFAAAIKAFGVEADIAHKAAVRATAVSELSDAGKGEKGGKSDFIKNKVYTDAKGNKAIWDGSKFVEAQ